MNRQIARDKNLRKERFCVVADQDIYLALHTDGLAKTVQAYQDSSFPIQIYEYIGGIRYYRGCISDGEWKPVIITRLSALGE